MSEDSKQNAPPPMSLKDHQAIESFSKKAIELAQQFVDIAFKPPDIDLLKHEIAHLQKNSLDPERREILFLLVRMAPFIPHSWKEFPDSYAVRSCFTKMLEELIAEYGEQSVKQLLIEDFTFAILRQESPDVDVPFTYSNIELACAYNTKMHVGSSGTK